MAPPRRRLRKASRSLPTVDSGQFDAAMDLIESFTQGVADVSINPGAREALQQRPRVRRLLRLGRLLETLQ